MAPQWNLSPNPPICMLNLLFSLIFPLFWAQVFDHKTSWHDYAFFFLSVLFVFPFSLLFESIGQVQPGQSGHVKEAES